MRGESGESGKGERAEVVHGCKTGTRPRLLFIAHAPRVTQWRQRAEREREREKERRVKKQISANRRGGTVHSNLTSAFTPSPSSLELCYPG